MACQGRIVLGGDTPNIVIPALRTTAERIHQIHAEIVERKRTFAGPLDPPAGTLAPRPHMFEAILKAAGEDGEMTALREIGLSTTSQKFPTLSSPTTAPRARSLQPELSRLQAVMPGDPVEGAGIKCSVCNAKPFAAAFGDAREDSDLMRFDARGRPSVAGKGFCSKHFARLSGDRYRIIDSGDAGQ